ncbi:MAG: FAD-dependent monooxygenase [Trichocoleus desertorum ATA4-8-CV12]|jgi:kynurenine 3-monooxygenase|nr:FAD-dependent monooxygenase [Trichocoleus desertorum ATA4-8-CV12]
MAKRVAIVGAGPSGVLLAHYLLRRDEAYQIEIYDRRPDPRSVSFEKVRTYPLTLNARGIHALSQIEGLEASVKAHGTAIWGTAVHGKNGKTRILSRQKPLFALDRTQLVITLLEKLTETYPSDRLTLHFNCKCIAADFERQSITFESITESLLENNVAEKLRTNYDLLIGADGAGSVIRDHFLPTDGFTVEAQYIPTDYKALFPLRRNETVELDLKPEHIHSWRLDDSTTVLAVPISDAIASGVITFSRNNKSFVNLSTTTQVLDFFRQNFPDLSPLIADAEAEALLNRPVSQVPTIRCSHYHYGNSVLLMGDAAHAVSPSLGQGCNAAFEDVEVLDRLLDEYSDTLNLVLPEFSIRRKPDAHALVELSDSPFPLVKALFVELMVRQKLGKVMHRLLPQYFPASLFELLSDTRVPYAEILSSYRRWIAKVKRSNQKFLAQQSQ